jgi:beta-lactamase regulating signal transducer with metallopeptidase domain
MKIIKTVIFSVAVAIVSLTGVATVHAATPPKINCADPQTSQEAIQCGASNSNKVIDDPGPAATTSLNGTIDAIVNVLSVVVAAVAVIMIMIGGFRYVTSGGKQESVAGAKNTIMYAIIGLVIVALAQVIVKFVIHRVK